MIHYSKYLTYALLSEIDKEKQQAQTMYYSIIINETYAISRTSFTLSDLLLKFGEPIQGNTKIIYQ